MAGQTGLLHLDALPPRTTRGTIVRLLIQVGGMDKRKIGRIELRGRSALIEVPERNLDQLVKQLDGTRLGTQLIRSWRETLVSDDEDRRSSDGEEDHFDRLARLLELEAEAEARQLMQAVERLTVEDAERTGRTLAYLAVVDETSGLGGRTLITLARTQASDGLPWTRLGVGSPVLMASMAQVAEARGSRHKQRTLERWRGVISRRDRRQVQVAFEQWPELPSDAAPFRLDLAYDEVARMRQRQALDRARGANSDRLSQLRAILLGHRSPQFASQAPPQRWFDESLNASQREAIARALAARDLALIHGPPGTGKTTTLVELIKQIVAGGETVLACAPSNLAVDNLLEKLVRAGEQPVRIGHPARVLPQLRAHTLDLLVEDHDDMKIVRKLVKDAIALRDRAARYTRAQPAPGEKREMRGEARQMLADARHLEDQIVQNILDRAPVLCSTTTALDSNLLGQRTFDWAIVDEACQTTEPGCWPPVTRANRLVLAGDHCQLPPTVVSAEAQREGFSISMLERLMPLYGEEASRRLEVQYRMHQQIMDFSSHEFYDGALQADESVASHLLHELPDVEEGPWTGVPVRFIDTAGAGYDEQVEEDGASRLNPKEAELACRYVERLQAAGVAADDIAIIAPYAAQVRHLKERLSESELEIDTVDGFQGREKEAIIISLVRSNNANEIGFLSDIRRTNVALTRARRALIVIGDSATIGGHPFYQRMLEYFEMLGAYHSVWEEAE